MIKIEQIKIEINKFNDQNIIKKCAKKLNISQKDIHSFEIIKKSVDARFKPDIFYSLTVGLNLSKKLEQKFKNLKYDIDKSIFSYQKKYIPLPPIIIGFGPSGMFAALAMARMGLRPIVIEQGKCVEERDKDVNLFWNKGKLDKYSNVQFGEGGAGTFSDGKLNTNLNSPYCKKVINEFFKFGSPQEITYVAKPHIGSDKLKVVVKNLRNEIISLGGQILFSHKFINFHTVGETLKSVDVLDIKNNKISTFQTNHLLLCVGHSARDVFSLLNSKNINIKQKPFAMGVRIEQKQNDINIAQYGENYDKSLPPADYKLVAHLPNGRSIFTFCMCPGGVVVASSSNDGEIVTNGMSEFSRDKEYANSALLVNVTPQDYSSSHPLAGIEFQAKYEKLAFEIGGKNFNAPAQTVGNFLQNKKYDNISSTYKPNITITQIKNCLPDFVYESLKTGIPLLNQKVENFAKDENLIIAIESRSSCPLTIVRNEDYQTNIKGIYPVGEGAGYAGGIMSSAIDGIKVAEAIYKRL